MEKEALTDTSKGRGVKKSNIQEGHWQFLMDVVKSRLIDSSHFRHFIPIGSNDERDFTWKSVRLSYTIGKKDVRIYNTAA